MLNALEIYNALKLGFNINLEDIPAPQTEIIMVLEQEIQDKLKKDVK